MSVQYRGTRERGNGGVVDGRRRDGLPKANEGCIKK